MTNDQQFNISAKVYENPKLMGLVQSVSRQIELVVRDVTSFEYECYRKLTNTFEKYEKRGEEIRSELALAHRVVREVRNDFLKRRKLEQVSYFEDFAMEGKTYEIPDANRFEEGIEEQESLHEKIALLAQGDRKKEMILSAWVNGTNDSDISILLAQELGGKAESHRTYIKRFRAKCKDVLATPSHFEVVKDA